MGEGVLKKGLNVAPSCATCHGAHTLHLLKRDDATSKLRVAEPLRRLSQAGLGGIHGQRALSRVEERHGRLACLYRLPRGAHHSRPPGLGSPVAPVAVPATCGKCHGDKASMANMGVPSDRVSTFMDSYHGVALQRGDVKAANCASCHGNHDVRPASDPASTINPENLEKTCGACHPGAGK